MHLRRSAALRLKSSIEVWMQEGAGEKQLMVVNAGRSGDLAWCLATFSEGQVTGDGTSLNILERDADGNWQDPAQA